jgi:hypothetical protein
MRRRGEESPALEGGAPNGGRHPGLLAPMPEPAQPPRERAWGAGTNSMDTEC